MATALQGTDFSKDILQRVRYSHDAMIDLLLAEPNISRVELAAKFGFTAVWVGRVMNSDAFNARLAERRTEMVDPTLLMSIEERMRSLAENSMNVLEQKLATAPTPELALKALEITTKALGFGAQQQNLQMQNNFIVHVPPKAVSADVWASAHGNQQILATCELDEIHPVAVPSPSNELLALATQGEEK